MPPLEHERFVDGLLRDFSRDLFERLSAPARRSRRPVFIFGLPRSGTTLVEQVLASHSQIHGAGELRWRRRPSKPSRRAGPDRTATRLRRRISIRPAVDRLAERHLERLRPSTGGRSERIVDKMPDNYLYLGLLAAMFPRAVLDPLPPRPARRGRLVLDDRLPQHPLGQRPRSHRHALPPVPAADGHWRHVLPVPIHEVDYEETVADLEGGGPAAGGGLRPGMGAGLSGVPPHGTAGPHRQRHPGPPARVSAVGRAAETLRAGPERAFRGVAVSSWRPTVNLRLTDCWVAGLPTPPHCCAGPTPPNCWAVGSARVS